jgi:hypothetical protein
LIRVIGRMENNTERDCIRDIIKKKEKDFGKMEKELNGLVTEKNFKFINYLYKL